MEPSQICQGIDLYCNRVKGGVDGSQRRDDFPLKPSTKAPKKGKTREREGQRGPPTPRRNLKPMRVRELDSPYLLGVDFGTP